MNLLRKDYRIPTKIVYLLAVLVFISLPAIVTSVFAQASETTPANVFWLWSFLGRLHPMVVHFPVGLLFVALLFEWIARSRKTDSFKSTIRILTFTGALSSIVAVILGLLLSNTETYGSNLLPIHQWLGIATAVLACCTAWLYFKNKRLSYAFLITTVLGVTLAGHFGSGLTHGDDYLSSVLPGANTTDTSDGNNFVLASYKGTLSTQQVQDISVEVRTIFAHNCYNCHGPVKMKGELRLDGKDHLMKGGKNGAIVIAGKPGQSELIRRITLPRTHKEAMPSKGKSLTATEIATLELWIKQGAPWPEGPEKSLFRIAALEPRLPAIPPATEKLSNPIDLFVNSYFKKHKISWKDRVDDRTYMRRVYLDVIGLLPPPDSVDLFVLDPTPTKRSLLVQQLLNRNHDYVQHWITFWNDALRNDYSGTGYITGGRKNISPWLYNALLTNKPYNAFVKELISTDKDSEGFIRGISWRGTINSSQSTEMQAAQNVAQVFLGLNLKCASCHNSFISDWKLDDAYAFANLFSDSTLEINRCDKPTGKMAGRRILFKELGAIDSTAKKEERLKQLADYLVQPKDGRLYRTFVNRIWAQVMGRGIVQPVDVMDNIPWSQDLIDWMAWDFAATGFDIKKLIYSILTSETYQLPSVAIKEQGLIVAPDFVFNGMLRRRLSSEQFTDAVSKMIQPVYEDSMMAVSFLPTDIKTIIPFARASLMKNDAFQTILGRPNRENVSTSRMSQANLLQALELTNGMLFNQTIKKAALSWKQKYPDPELMVKEIYRNTLGRLPDTREANVARTALGKTPSSDEVEDFLWAIALHPSFQLIY